MDSVISSLSSSHNLDQFGLKLEADTHPGKFAYLLVSPPFEMCIISHSLISLSEVKSSPVSDLILSVERSFSSLRNYLASS